MRYETQTVRIGEKVGELDWSYDFRQHYWTKSSGGHNPAMMDEDVQRLREIADALAAGKRVDATTDGGWPRVGWHEVIDVGMYDGWPYWRPVPSVYTRGPLGGEWHSFCSISGAQVRE